MPEKAMPNKILSEIIDLARYSPSVHNTQPWLIKRTSSGIKVLIDKRHKLGSGDPTGRQTIISMGIFAEALRIAAEAKGVKVKDVSFKDNVVLIDFGDEQHINKNSAKLASLIKKRSTDRSIYKMTGIDGKLKDDIKHVWQSKNVRIWTVEQRDFIENLADLTSKGIGLALSNPEFRRELSDYLILPYSTKLRGISVKSLYLPYFFAILQPILLRVGLNSNQEASLEKKRWLSSSLVILITSDGDLHNDWFEAGRAYMTASLVIEEHGLSQATSAATVEASTFHEDIENMLGTKQRLQAVIRVGKGVRNRQYSPRIPTSEILT